MHAFELCSELGLPNEVALSLTPRARERIIRLSRRKFVELGKVVGDREPRRFGADKDVRPRTDRRCVDERAQRDVNECAIAHHRVQQRAATLAVGVMAVFITINQQLGCAVSDGQFAAQFEI